MARLLRWEQVRCKGAKPVHNMNTAHTAPHYLCKRCRCALIRLSLWLFVMTVWIEVSFGMYNIPYKIFKISSQKQYRRAPNASAYVSVCVSRPIILSPTNDRDDNILQKGCWEDFLKRVNMQAAAVAGECTWRRRRAIEEAQHLNLP